MPAMPSNAVRTNWQVFRGLSQEILHNRSALKIVLAFLQEISILPGAEHRIGFSLIRAKRFQGIQNNQHGRSGYKRMVDITNIAERIPQRLMEDTSGLICAVTLDGCIVHVNPAVTRILGYKPEEVAGREYWKLAHPEDLAKVREGERHCVETGRLYNFVNRYLHRNGQPVHMSWTCLFVPEDGMIYGIAHDVTALVEAQEASEKLATSLARMLDTIEQGYFTVSRNWELIHINRIFEETFQVSRENVLGRSIFDCLRGFSDSDLHAQLKHAMDFSGRVEAVTNFAPLNKIFEINASAAAEGLSVYFRDITESRKVEEDLATSLERFERVAQVSNDTIYDWDLSNDSLWFSDGIERTFRWAAETPSWTIQRFIEAVHPDDRQNVEASLNGAVNGQESVWTTEYRFLRGDGTYAVVQDRGFILRNPQSDAIRMVGGMADVTDTKNIQNRLYWQADLLDRTTDVIIVCRTDGVIVFWNRKAENILGWISEEVVGQNARKLFGHPDETVTVAINTVLQRGEWNGEITRQNKYGEQLTFDCRWVYMPESEIEAECLLLVCTDVTERRKLEAQFQRAQRLESIGTLAGGIAHDLNNVLAPILLAMDILRGQVHTQEGRMILETIEASAQRAASMVNQLLLYSRGVEGDRHPINPVPIINDVVHMLRQTFPKTLTIEQDVDEYLANINVDPTQLHQVILNLCVNARDAVGESGNIEIHASNYFIDKLNSSKALQAGEGDYVHISVRDDGEGIPPEIMDKIFEPFFTTKEQGKGTGLGLSTVLAIVKSLGGFIELTSEVGYGSKFDVYLPCVSNIQDPSADGLNQRMPRGYQELILVVDDEKPVRDITKETLELYGYRVVTARDGAEAIAIYAQKRSEIQVVLTDMMMPVMDGPALVNALQHINPNIQIIGASGLGSQGGVAKAANAGVLHFLPKPYSASSLLCLLRNLLNHEGDGTV